MSTKNSNPAILPAQSRFAKLHTFIAIGALGIATATVRPDVVEMANGDHYSGTVLAVTLTNVTVRSEIQGPITLPRAKVARITFRDAAPEAGVKAVPVPSALSPALKPKPTDSGSALREGSDTNAIARVQKEVLGDADGEATRKYNELARKLMSGSLGVGDIRKQAQQTIADAEKAKKELGPEGGELLDGYLEVLRRFVEDSAPVVKPEASR